ncbi:MAG TPA: ribonuclease Z [Candidatus Methanofastidiosa archaeon]|nr:ribonuclease Z [Candidatus Methanofastidiosa archaeon]HPR42351.1 ribonuclease Z [Candidatus Methanofastidiosa archaeon]
MKIVFMGTAGTKPSPERNPSCIAISYARDVILLDCGEGCQRQMLRKVKQSRIRGIFITHFHGDHYLGLPGLLMTMSLNGREDPLDIYGPEGAVGFIKSLFSSGYMDITYDVRVRELGKDMLRFDGYSIYSFPVQHGIPSLGYMFKQDDKRGSFDSQRAADLGVTGRMFSALEHDGQLEIDGRTVKLDDVTLKKKTGIKITYSGDTRPIDFPMETKGSELLIHEATFLNEGERGDTYHSTVKDACEAAIRMNAKRLVLTHINSRYDDETLLEEAKKYYENVTIAEDLMEVEI